MIIFLLSVELYHYFFINFSLTVDNKIQIIISSNIQAKKGFVHFFYLFILKSVFFLEFVKLIDKI